MIATVSPGLVRRLPSESDGRRTYVRLIPEAAAAIDPVARTVELRVPNIDLDWCEGRIPVGDEWIEAAWVREGRTVRPSLTVPRGLQAEVITRR